MSTIRAGFFLKFLTLPIAVDYSNSLIAPKPLGQSNHNIAVICLVWSNFKNFIRWFRSWNGQNIHSLYIINWNKRKLFHGASGYNWKKNENIPWNIWLQQGKKFHGASGYNWNKKKMFHGASGYNWYTMKMFHRVSGYNWKKIKISMEHLVTVRLKWKCSMEHLVTTKKNENVSWNIWLQLESNENISWNIWLQLE